MFKKHKVVMLPTNEKAQIVKKRITNELKISSLNNPQLWNSQHLYILSDEEIKEGDWVFCLREGYEPILQQKVNPEGVNKDPMMKKIIATTDKSFVKIINDIELKIDFQIPIFPQPSQSFIEKYVEEYNRGNVITDVMVEYIDNGEEDWIGDDYTGEPFWNEKVELKINPKDNIITIL